jgi:hypothetical protein
MRNSVLKIPRTLEVLCDSMRTAETLLQEEIASHSPDINEEAVTRQFHSSLSKALDAASAERKLEVAFLSDLKAGFPDLVRNREIDFQKVARGLRAQATLHEKATERFTGGDFGLVIARPNLQRQYSSGLSVRDYQRALLVQAKMRTVRGWGSFTQNQQRVLPSRLSYLALLLYQYTDEARRILAPFEWQESGEMSIDDLRDSLRSGKFPNPIKTSEIIERLGNGETGTDDRQVIDEVISPKKNPALILRIDWPPGKGPGSEVRFLTRHERGTQAVTVRS